MSLRSWIFKALVSAKHVTEFEPGKWTELGFCMVESFVWRDEWAIVSVSKADYSATWRLTCPKWRSFCIGYYYKTTIYNINSKLAENKT